MTFARDPVLLVGLPISLAIAVLAYLAGMPPELSLLVALVASTLTLSADLVFRLNRHEANAEQRAELAVQLRRIPTLRDHMTTIAPHLERIEGDVHAERFRQEARELLLSTEKALRRLAEGYLEDRYTDTDLAVLMVQEAQQEFSTTMLFRLDREWWTNPLEKDYYRANLDAVRRGVTVQRVIIYPDEGDPATPPPATIAEFAHSQLADGIEVWMVPESRVSHRDHVVQAVADDRYALELLPDPHGKPDRVVLSIDPDEINEKRRRFKRLLKQADRIEPQQR